MEIKYIIEKEQRKALAQKIAELAGAEVQYLGVPSCAYQIGGFTLTKDAVLTFEDSAEAEAVLAGLNQAGYASEEAPTTLTVQMPKSFFTFEALENLRRITANKENLIKHALDASFLDIIETDETVEFPWFTLTVPGDGEAYTKFISALCEFAKNQKRVNNKPDTSDNEKYAFRCFLLRLGMIGSDYKHVRKVLLRNLTGSSAYAKK